MITSTKTTYDTYPAYKDSGEYWLGEIPEHWEIYPGLKFVSENKSKNTGMIRNTVLSLSYGKIRVKHDDELTGLVPESFETYQLVNKGDLIFRPTDLQNDKVSLRSAYSEYDGIITNAYINLKFKEIANSKFFHYLFRAIDNNKIIYGLGSGLRQNISYLDFRRFLFPFPPLPEQTAIAKFLDDKTAKIDRAIAQKEKMIALLKERKQIIIQNAVTKGLDPNAKMKDSGVEWIGEIPEGWEVKRLKSICKTFGRIGFRGYSTSDLVDEGEGAITISPSNIQGDFMTFEKCTYLSWNKFHESPEIKIYKNDVLIVKTGSTFGKVGLASNLDSEATINPQLLVFKEVKIDHEYFYEVLNSSQVQIQINKEVIGSTIPTISENKILNMKVGLPPENDIPEIIENIKSAKSKFNDAIRIQVQQIEKLKELKSTLIDSAVTGKIKVS